MTPPRVAIIGSGLTGLLTAQGLQKNGIHVTVYEGDPAFESRSRDWTIMLHWGLNTLSNMLPPDVYDTFPEAFCDPFYKDETPPALPCLDNTTGEPLFHIPSTWMRLISRQRFRKVLTKGLDIRYSKKLSAVEDKNEEGPVTLVFEDGTHHEADIVVGADGPKSMVRTHLLGDRAANNSSPWVISIALVTYDEVEQAKYVRAPHPVWHMVYGPDGCGGIAVSDVGESNDPKEWHFYYFLIWREDLPQSIRGAEALAKFKAKGEKFCEPFRSAARWIPEGSLCNVDQLKYWPTEEWDNRGGRVTLAGDAAHSVMPFRGQGFNHCMEDCTKLVDTIIKIRNGADHAETMSAYDAELCARGRAAALASVKEGERNMNYEKLLSSQVIARGFSKENHTKDEAANGDASNGNAPNGDASKEEASEDAILKAEVAPEKPSLVSRIRQTCMKLLTPVMRKR